MNNVIYSPSCTPKNDIGNTFSATKLENLQPSKLAAMKGYLFCPGCFVQAGFVSRGKNGSSPHFRSIHKLVNGKACPEKSNEVERIDGDKPRPVDELRNDENIFVIDFNFGTTDREVKPNKPIDTDDIPPRLRGNYRKFGESGSVGKSEWSRRLSTMLRAVFDNPDFLKEANKIKVFGKLQTMSEVFFHASRVVNTLNHNRPPAFYYGTIVDAIDEGKTVWLNIGHSKDELSIPIDKKIFQVLMKRYAISPAVKGQFRDIVGCQFLLYGWYNTSKKKQHYLSLYEKASAYIALRLS
ncbi:hypothetical protein [Pseudoalteromonas rubra]|uniref:Uncharacterized protein n=1 Tax=Pseudoalteromonas rubra TaxID=43658 RepID=A0A0F4QJU0_9GAMM|nr:hypothetical protein [Pseudoalteromonas rubra]KJZ07589.1 hypothetical protein TW77_14935 [Pseudoalteromonas rubra]